MSEPGMQVQSPVVVTFDGADLVETFGDLSYFTGTADSESLLRSLCDLLVGQGDAPPLLRAVELSPGRYADVHVVPEGGLCHLVLLDATAGVLEARQLQQTKYDALLAGTGDEEPEENSRDVRARLDAMAGYAGALVSRCNGEPEAMRALGYIQRTSAYLEARLPDDTAEPAPPRPVRLDVLVDELRALFVMDGERGPDIDLASAASQAAPVVVDYRRVRRLLVMLLTLALDAADGGEVDVYLDSPGGDLLVAIDVQGVPAEPAVTLGLQACRRLARAMGGQLDVDIDGADAGMSHLRVLLPQ